MFCVSCSPEGHEGRAGMAVLTLREGAQFEGVLVYQQVVGLPSYARPRFIRIQVRLLRIQVTQNTGGPPQDTGEPPQDTGDSGNR